MHMHSTFSLPMRSSSSIPTRYGKFETLSGKLKLQGTASVLLKAQIVSSYNRSLESHPTADYPMLHETARHSIHSIETLEIAVECLLAMCQQHTLLYKLNSSNDKFHEVIHTKTHQALQFHLQVLRSLKARSQANDARLRNEITLVRGTLNSLDPQHLAKFQLGIQYSCPTRQPQYPSHQSGSPQRQL